MAFLTRDILRDELDVLLNRIEGILHRQLSEQVGKLHDASSSGPSSRLFSTEPKMPPSPSALKPSTFMANPPSGNAPKLIGTTMKGKIRHADDDMPLRLLGFDARSISGPMSSGSRTSPPQAFSEITDDPLDAWEEKMKGSPESMISTFHSEEEVEEAVLQNALRPKSESLPNEAPEPPITDELDVLDISEQKSSMGSSTVNVHPMHSGLSNSSNSKAMFSMSRELRRGQLYARLVPVVRHWCFDYAIGILVILNCVVMGIETEYLAAQRPGGAIVFHVCSVFFCLVFCLELAARIYVDGVYFFQSRMWRWNIFDVMLVTLQLFDEIFVVLSHDESMRMNVTFMRSLHFIYTVRVLRGARTLRLIGELRTLVSTIAMSIGCLAWTVVLLAFMICLLSIWFTQIVARFSAEVGSGHDGVKELEIFYGSMGHTALTLFQAISGGIDWGAAMQPLVNHISPIMGLVFICYVVFSLFALMNVVNGVFVDLGIRNAKNDMDLFMQTNVRELFSQTDGGMTAELSWEDFKERLDEDQMREYFKAIDVDLSEARAVWRLLDLDGSDTVSAEEFMSGCLRLRGPAKAIDLAIVLHELRRLTDRFKVFEQRGSNAQRGSPRSSTASLGSFTMPWERQAKPHGTSPSAQGSRYTAREDSNNSNL